MAARLYVGNLPSSTTEDELRRLFSQAGTVDSVTIPTERETGRPRGFAFLDMSNQSEGENAIRMFDGYRMDDRSLRVQMAMERPAPSGYRRSAGGGGRHGY